MRIHKVIQFNLNEKKKDEEEREFIAAQEAKLVRLLQASDLRIITFRKGWWIFGYWYRIEVDCYNKIHYEQYGLGPARGWRYCYDNSKRSKLLKHLMS